MIGNLKADDQHAVFEENPQCQNELESTLLFCKFTPKSALSVC